MNWTSPYCGVQHLNGLRKGFRVTVVERDGFVECLMALPSAPFSPTETMHATVDEAMSHGLAWAKVFGALS